MGLSWLVKTGITIGIRVAVSAVGYVIRRRTERSSRARSSEQNNPPPTTNYHTYNADTQNQDQNDLKSCVSFFEDGMEMLLTSLDQISRGNMDAAETNTEGIRVHGLAHEIDVLAALKLVFTADIHRLKTVSKESFAWAKSSFKAARDDATRAFNNESLSINDRLSAAKVRSQTVGGNFSWISVRARW